MPSLLNKTLSSLKNRGLIKTLRNVVRYSFNRYPLNLIKRNRFQKNVLSLDKIEDRFTAIYERNVWGNDESVSGWGSTLTYTAHLRSQLPALFEKYAVKSVFDAPCGDFNWMRHVLQANELTYTGGDIVEPLIAAHNEKFGSSATRFIHINLIVEKFPLSDLMICRDCLFHLSFRDTRSVLQNFVDSGIPYLLTTTYVNNGLFENKDIQTGDFRLIDLFSAPYILPRDVGFRVDDFQPPEPKREMCLWTREQIASALPRSQLPAHD